jgi:hypothetical protein
VALGLVDLLARSRRQRRTKCFLLLRNISPCSHFKNWQLICTGCKWSEFEFSKPGNKKSTSYDNQSNPASAIAKWYKWSVDSAYPDPEVKNQIVTTTS